ncbi:hypothetical protein [Candidatus Palauibacter irciniicola]|uniref:hypothetical protein n=1 Tax=Candidatus Palauibacter irciniicola TaxID=3056733 RepID=UPI003B01A0D3
MTSIKAHEHSYLDAVISGVGGVTTVSDGPDNGANNFVACAFWKAMRHSTTKEAIKNLLSKLPNTLASRNDSDFEILEKGIGQLNICGHGNEGFITTGIGQDGVYNDQAIMTIWNEGSWGSELDKLNGKKFTILTFWSCNTGAGKGGADFLYAVAKRIGRPVRGNTGLLYSNAECKVWLEKGAQWQVATPTSRPTPIAAPTMRFTVIDNKTVTFEDDDMIDPEKSTKLTLLRMRVGRHGSDEIDVPEGVQRKIISDLAGAVELELPGKTLGYRSHTITIAQKDSDPVELGIINGRLIVDGDETRGIMIPPSLRIFL